MPVTKTCERCGNPYTCRPSKAAERKYCGPECARLERIYLTEDSPSWDVRNPDKAKIISVRRFTKYYLTPNGRAEHLLNNARGRAGRKRIGFSLTKEWVLEKLERGTCEVTGLPLVLESNGGRGHKTNSFAPSIDRIDQTGEYSPENCRIVVWIYNRARGAFPDNDFDRMVEAITKKEATV